MDSFSQTLADLDVLIRDTESAPAPEPKLRDGPKVCRDCGETDQDKMVKFWCSRTSKQVTKNRCKPCFNRYTAQKLSENPERYNKKQKRQSRKSHFDRKNNIRIERFILTGSKASDKKFGRKCDLTKEFIANEIAKGCQYCGETSIKMSMDRIDNSIGHLKTNVVPACVRCNYVRRDMPYKAWLKVAESMRAVREAGDFGDWTCEILRGNRKFREAGAISA